MSDVIVLDLETQKSFAEVGGYEQTDKLGVSVCVIYSYNDNKYYDYRETQLNELGNKLKNASLIVGFNSKHFDFTVLQPYINYNLKQLPHLDILEEITAVLGHRLKLDSLAHSTLGSGKSGDGLDAIWYYKNNEWEKLVNYCRDDVRVTKDVYQYGKNHGYLWYDQSGIRTKIPINWACDATVSDLIKQSLNSGRQLEIEYNQQNGQPRIVHTVDIKNIIGERIQAWCQQTQMLAIYNLPQIFSAKIIGNQENFQKSLF
jgi:hypothetical protein